MATNDKFLKVRNRYYKKGVVMVKRQRDMLRWHLPQCLACEDDDCCCPKPRLIDMLAV